MTNAKLIQKIRIKIERLRDEYTDIAIDSHYGTVNANHVVDDLEQLLSFLSDLEESEKPMQEGLEEEVKRYYSDNFEYISSDQPTLSILTNIARHFAQWQKEQMMQEAVEKTVCLVPSLVGPKMFTTSIELSADELKGFKPGDKVRVIILQKED